MVGEIKTLGFLWVKNRPKLPSLEWDQWCNFNVLMLFAASIEIPLCKERFSAACSSANFLDSFICFSISLFLKA
ncbi:hypothetical protein HanXRQr2_Chr11g0508781 [Helianthus annuus]|uniref:Uncharacterized protein n=1 Tax=Helianthus annuus TaxID=4232 RepID=A0A9K3HSL8_HELAN|nr:hypothetical protein HanXRQr2_Chr11g0508781 [Helianthus annuus]